MFKSHLCETCYAKHVELNKKVANTDAGKAYIRNITLLANFGLSKTDYDSMVTLQLGLCAICLRPETRLARGGDIQRLSVDHDHRIGKIRGLLCDACNLGIGHFREDHELIATAITYLKEASSGPV